MHVSISEVQQWLEITKFEVTYINTELEVAQFATVSTALVERYPVDTWINEATTPDMIRSLVSMLIAGFMYNAQNAENASDAGSWGTWLINYANKCIASLAGGKTQLPGVVREDFTYPSFWPTQVATDMADPTLGGNPADPTAAPRVFKMGTVF